MPFLRFARDKRGYEHIYLMHAGNRRGKPGRPRLLYWYRTPPGVKVGRIPFDDDVRRALEAQHPGIAFDWKTITSTPMPPPDAEPWRERRRQERAAKQLRSADEPTGDAAGDAGPDGEAEEVIGMAAELAVGGHGRGEVRASSGDDATADAGMESDIDATAGPAGEDDDADGESAPGEAAVGGAPGGPEVPRRKRRRRRRRRPQGAGQSASGALDVPAMSGEPVVATSPEASFRSSSDPSDRQPEGANSDDQ